GFGLAIMILGTVTALSGGVVSLLQPDVKKVLAASTSAHFGLMFVAVGAGFPGLAVLHLVTHGFFKALLFLSAGIAIERSGSHQLSAMRLGRALPVVAILAAVGAAALAGLPPLGAAWTKDAIVVAAATSGVGWSAAVIVAGGLSAAYAVRWIWLAYGLGEAAESSAEDSTPAPAPSPAVTASLAWLALASVLLSALWLPSVREALTGALSIALPRESTTLIGIAIGAVAIGALTGRWIAVRMPTLGRGDLVAPVADWWRLPTLIDIAVTTPMAALARASARVDDVVIDAIPRAIGHAGKWLATQLAREDRRVVDRGVRLATTFVEWLSRATSRIGEFVADGVARGPARLVSLGAQDAQRLQTGLSHHAFAVLLLGALALGSLLLAIRL
ncbi:MAG: NADH-quinone oxidoreductase subunit L, partial [Pseudomonadota bacterium]|nr:NADH-quinone oxidoreductase subunit L [Pseudomonadota bacterium]